MKSIRHHCMAALAALCIFSHIHAGESQTPAKKILCTTYPIYQFTRNIIKGSPFVTAELLLPAAMGCPHDYALTPQDMARIANADILVVNGMGMEEFLGRPIELANPTIAIIDSSHGIRDIIIHRGDEHSHAGDDDNHERRHHHDGPNPHLFTSPALSAQVVETIGRRLCLLEPANATLYATNAAEYADTLRALAKEMAESTKGFANNRIVEQHSSFEYLARDMGLEVVGRLQSHGQALSASEMLNILDVVREKKPGVFVLEPQYPGMAGRKLAAETGLPVITLDSLAAGPEDAPLNHYETVMRANLEQLKKALGGQ